MTHGEPMALALIALLLLELVLQLAWNARYWCVGIVVFTQTLPASAAARNQLALGSLQHDVDPAGWLPLAFHRLPDGSLAFRERWGASVARRYYPVMRGRIVVDARRREVRVLGLCNWNVLAIALSSLPVAMLHPASAALLLVLPLFWVSHVFQRRRFLVVVQALRAQLDTGRSVEAMLDARMLARRPR